MIEGRINKLQREKTFITVKVHKSNFPNNSQCSSRYSTENSIGKIIKCIDREQAHRQEIL